MKTHRLTVLSTIGMARDGVSTCDSGTIVGSGSGTEFGSALAGVAALIDATSWPLSDRRVRASRVGGDRRQFAVVDVGGTVGIAGGVPGAVG